ncbi:TlpA family protein disulfide reductase [Saccharicrinis aurantiacus]|uniref:TlpA family protein disulfide reductase n=1 Tax=Saccharicrinis aurantiacus TaxID=1849719 RepID=UPI00094FBC87|nr:TlpA family protein disulfide reductase [Saccharicrinis aurantiacus]
MKRIIFLFIATVTFVTSATAQGYKIDVNINGWQDTTLILGHYFNKKMLVNDTIDLDSNGNGTFTGEEKLPGGVYIIYMPDQNFFDIIIDDEQHFQIAADKSNPVNTLTVKNNKQEAAFNKYQRFIAKQQEKAKSLQEQIKTSPEDPSVADWKEELGSLSTEVNKQWDHITANNPNTFLASFITAMREVEIPDFAADKSLNDSIIQWKKYEYYKNHYFDNIDLKDDRLLRTPFFTNKLESFFTKTVFQMPDSLSKEAKRIVKLAEGNSEMEKYLIQYTFNLVNESKVMGMDAAMVDLAETFYLSGKADWVDQEFIDKLQDRVSKLKPNLLGNTAPDLKLYTPNKEAYKLSEVFANYTILVFWEPDCGHCKKEIPKIKELVYDKYQDKGVKVFAVYTQFETEHWTEFIEEKQLEEWINVYDPYNQSNFRNLYDIYSTPVIYVLDKDKNIVAKRIGAEQIPDFLDHQFNLVNK